MSTAIRGLLLQGPFMMQKIPRFCFPWTHQANGKGCQRLVRESRQRLGNSRRLAVQKATATDGIPLNSVCATNGQSERQVSEDMATRSVTFAS